MVFVIVWSGGCYYDVEEVLYPAGSCQTENMSYQTNIEPIIQRNCYVCHSQAANQGSITLEGYTNLLTYVQNGRLSGAIRHEPGFSPMPQNGPQLSDCDIAKIEQWVASGAPNN